MALKEIKWIENQLNKLQSPDLDLNVWKASACLMLDSIFGTDNFRSKQIEALSNKFNSWSLRDATGNESYEERNQRMAAEILQSAIDELEMMGLPKKDDQVEKLLKELLTIIFDELKGNQVKKLRQIITADLPTDDKKRQLSDILREAGGGDSILINLMLHPAIGEMLKEQ